MLPLCRYQPLSLSTLLLAGTSLLIRATGAAYVLVDDYSGTKFFKSFDFFTDTDPTNGLVKFKSMAEANATGLAGLINGGNATNAVYLGVDSTKEASRGRDSVRVSSRKKYQHALVVADIVHMPGSVCGTWPAFWMVGDDWPKDGEIDIVEGVNDQSSNQMTLHTSAGARISNSNSSSRASSSSSHHPPQQAFTGKILTTNCDVNAPNQSKNAGCAIEDNTGLTFGKTFNENGGGVYAMEWTSEFIKIWFFPRGSFPPDISSASPSPSTNWGPPTSLFQFQGNLTMDDHFRNLSIVFDTTFCGDWAGNTWNQTSCASLAPTCEQYVAANAGAFADVYWGINTLMVFQDDGVGGPNRTKFTGDRGVGQDQVGVGILKRGPPESAELVDGDKAVKAKWMQAPARGKPRQKGGGAVLRRRR